jgi:RND family efflux transporter MFP subunit
MRYANSLVLLATALFVLGTAGCGSDPNADQSAAENPAMGQPGHDHEAMLAEMAAAAAENPAMGEPGHDHEAMLAEMAAADHADHDSMADSDAMNMPRQGSSAMQSASDQSESVDHSAHQMTPATGAAAGIVSIEPSVIQTSGVRTTTVEVRSLSREIRSTGRFEMDESGIHTVTVRTPGWIEALHVDYEGALVTKGQPLLDLYSPDLVATQEEYLLAFRNAQRMSASPIEGMAKDAERLLSAARGRLILWEITEDQIAELERTGKPMRTVRFNVPATGEVMRKSVTEGQHVQAGEPLLEIYDLSKIWLIADIYEQDLPWVQEGLPVRVELPYDPGKTFEGRVDHVYYMLDTKTRTARARIIMPGQRQVLKPGMYATVRIQSKPLAPAPVVPEEAVIRTGEQDVVIVDLGDGQFAPTVVRIGILAEGSYQILHGLSGGERIVTRAQFLIDSESRLKSAVGAMTGHSH